MVKYAQIAIDRILEVGCPVVKFFYMPSPLRRVVLDPVYLITFKNPKNYE